MTPKEKAVELYNNYYQHVADGAYPELNAKQCALICVDEILKELDNFGNDDGYQFSRVEYYQQVKQEIEEL